MWPVQLFWKSFLAYAGLFVLALAISLAIVSSWQEDQLIEQVRGRLRDSAILLRDELHADLAADNSESLQKKVQRKGAATGTRFTLVANDGTVLADSEQETFQAVEEMENHLSRNEFVGAEHHGHGHALRDSATLGTPFLYYAISVKSDDEVLGFVRAAQQVSSIQEKVASLRRVIWMLGGLVGLTGIVVTYWITRRIVLPIQELTEMAELIAVGEYPQSISIRSDDEVGTFAHSFESMSKRLRSREEQLRETVQRQMAVLGGMIEGVIAVDGEHRVLFANAAAGRKLGFHPEEIEGWSLLEVVRSHELREIVQQSLQSHEYRQGEFQWTTDVQLSLEVTATPLPGRPCPGVVVVLHDVTDLKRLEGLRQQFVSNVSHELKTPLSSIKAYTETLLSCALEDTQHARKFLSRIDDQADRLHDLILDMLSLARIESGQAAMDLADVSLDSVVEQCIRVHEPRTASGITVCNSVAGNGLEVRADEEGLLQILSNLVDNAIKYTPSGGAVTIQCRVDNKHALIEVVDTGIGIARSHLGRLFERFYRVDKARSRELGGTGLGLSIVKHLCQAMGGSVSVQSVPQQGSTFGVRIPLVSRSSTGEHD